MRRARSIGLILGLVLFGCAPKTPRSDGAPDDHRALDLEIARLRGRIALLEQELDRFRDRERCLELELARLDHPVFELPEVRPTSAVPLIDATVSDVRDDSAPAAIFLDRGLLDGVDRGLQFIIYREHTFVGKVVVEKADERRATARILFTAPDQAVQRGDKAATRID